MLLQVWRWLSTDRQNARTDPRTTRPYGVQGKEAFDEEDENSSNYFSSTDTDSDTDTDEMMMNWEIFFAVFAVD